jgi:hypothetical protein
MCHSMSNQALDSSADSEVDSEAGTRRIPVSSFKLEAKVPRPARPGNGARVRCHWQSGRSPPSQHVDTTFNEPPGLFRVDQYRIQVPLRYMEGGPAWRPSRPDEGCQSR